MVQFKVGDTITLCASIRDFCSTSGNFYFVNDINCSIGTCNINTTPFSCLPASGQTVEFKWASGSVDITNCISSNIFKNIGSSITDNNGVASIQYTITQNDLDLYNTNSSSFDLMVCIIESPIRSKLRRFTTFHVGDYITITPNLCLGVTCSDICVGNDLYYRTCDTITGNCTQGNLKEANSLICASTHYIEYDLSLLPSEFLNYVSTYITDITNNIGSYLYPILPRDVTYNGLFYDNQTKKFRLYVKYTGILSLGIHNTQNLQNTHNIQNLYIDIPQALTDAAFLISGIILFIIGAIIVVVVPGYGIVIGPIVAVAGMYAAQWSIKNLQTNIQGGGTRSISDSDKIKIVQDYAALLVTKCTQLHPGCCQSPCIPTCSPIEMSSFNKCMGANQLAEYTWDHGINKNFNQTDYDNKKNSILTDSTCLQNGTCTTTQVANNIQNRETDRTTDSNNQLQTAKAKEKGNLTRTLLIAAGILTIGYITYNIVKSK